MSTEAKCPFTHTAGGLLRCPRTGRGWLPKLPQG